MGYTAPFTAVAGTPWRAADWNVYGRDNIAWIATDSPACRAYSTVAVSVAHATDTPITLNAERFDNANVHSTVSNTSRFTVPAGGDGRYIVTGSMSWQPNASGGLRGCILRINGTTKVGLAAQQPSGVYGSDATIVAVYAMVAADYAEMCGIQDSGGALNVTTIGNYSPEASILWFRT